MTRRRVAIIGGGMAGLSAAWRLTRPDGPGADVTVYQRGWRLGGKGASSRGAHGRIQEHGLHVWLGYYDNAFRLLGQVYDELDRSGRDPGCPIRTVQDAFTPSHTIGLREAGADGPLDWVAIFPPNDLTPGTGGEPTLAEFVNRARSLLASFADSLVAGTAPAAAVLSTRPRPPAPGRAVLAGVSALATDADARRRAAAFAELIAVMLRGVFADDLYRRGYTSIDHLDFREWLALHGASPAVLDGPLVRGVYDLVFGYEGGDRSRPRFAAGIGVYLSTRMFLTYRGAMFWKMRAGMGDVVFAPLYEALARRGVRFAFFHRLESLQLSPDGDAVASVSFARQLDVADYQPLVRVGGLPVFPEWPTGVDVAGCDLEQHGCGWADAGRTVLRAGTDFDDVVLAVSLGMVPEVCGEILERDGRWRDMVAHVGTVATESVQLWLDADERALGARPGIVITGYGEPFDTLASMTHTIPSEAWPAPAPRTAVTLCGVLAEGLGVDAVDEHLRRFVADEATSVWPGFTTEHLRAEHGTYRRANTDPSDRYVQSLPGTDRYRLRADDTGIAGLVIAGDWLDTGLNAGCIEAATLGGLQAANAVEGRPLTDGTVGFAPHVPQARMGA